MCVSPRQLSSATLAHLQPTPTNCSQFSCRSAPPDHVGTTVFGTNRTIARSRMPSPFFYEPTDSGIAACTYCLRTCLFGLFLLEASLANTLFEAIPAETVNPSSCSTARRIAAVRRAPASRARSNAFVGSMRCPAVPYGR